MQVREEFACSLRFLALQSSVAPETVLVVIGIVVFVLGVETNIPRGRQNGYQRRRELSAKGVDEKIR